MNKRILLLLCTIASFIANAQESYSGKGDVKFQVGANFQNGGNGIISTVDFGLGENMSYGFSASYLLGANNILGIKPKFEDRADFRARFNANLGKVINIDEKIDIYPGLDLGLRNFGGHVGARYFFSQGFGLYTEAGFPIAKYDSTPGVFGHLNNQFNVSFGMSFNL
jgi:hypothetical protein